MASVSIRHLDVHKPASEKRAHRLHKILDDVSLSVLDGELLVLIGPSGCGKSTLLRCLAGLEAPSRGEILLDGEVINDVAPRERDIAMVFQSYALYPHMTVFENLAFGLRMRKTPPAEVISRVDEALNMLKIAQLAQRYPRELSGGQRQRVAMGRAVVRRPRVFLFDEPLSNLDASLRQQMRLELLRLHRRLKTTTIYVTHDQVEAMTLAQRIAVLKQGKLIQVGTPADLYDRPINTFVARFFGTPEMNLIAGQVKDGCFVADGEGLQIATAGYPSGPAIFGIRPEHLHLLREEPTNKTAVADHFLGHADIVENLGSEALVHVRVAEHVLIARCPVEHAPPAGNAVIAQPASLRWHLFARSHAADGMPQDGVRLQPSG